MCIRDRQWIVLHDQQLQPQPGGVLTQARRLSKLALLNDYVNRFAYDFLAVLPPLDKAPT